MNPQVPNPKKTPKVPTKKRDIASKMVPKGHKMHPSGTSYIGKKK